MYAKYCLLQRVVSNGKCAQHSFITGIGTNSYDVDNIMGDRAKITRYPE